MCLNYNQEYNYSSLSAELTQTSESWIWMFAYCTCTAPYRSGPRGWRGVFIFPPVGVNWFLQFFSSRNISSWAQALSIWDTYTHKHWLNLSVMDLRTVHFFARLIKYLLICLVSKSTNTAYLCNRPWMDVGEIPNSAYLCNTYRQW